MKKILYVMISLLFMTSINKVYASSYTLELTGDNEFTDEITLNLSIASLNGFTNGFYGLETTINYDDTKLQLIEITGLSDFEVVYDSSVSNKFVTYVANGVNAGTDVVAVTFKNIGLSIDETTEVSLTNQLASDGEVDVTSSTPTKKSFKLVKPAYTKGDLNKNGKIDLPDIILLLKKYLGVEGSSNEDIQLGDMDNSGTIGLKDVILLLKTYLGVA